MDHHLFPLLPPNRFLYLDKKTVVNVTSINDARWHYNTYLELPAWNRKRRKYVHGALYTNIFHDTCRTINLGKGEGLDITVMTELNIESTVSIFVEPNRDHPHLHNCCNLGRIILTYLPNSYRKNCGDKGCMYIVERGRLG